MDKISTFKELIDFSIYKYKSRTALIVEGIYTKNINYFELKFDICSLARAMANDKKDDSVIIISENRYEYIVTFLANILLNKRIIIMKNMFDIEKIIELIKNKNVRTIYFSNKYKNIIKEIIKKYKEKINENKLILINYDSNNELPIKEYEKILNMGRYIENYSVDDIEIEKNARILLVENEIENEFNSKDFIKCAKSINKIIKFGKRKKTEAKEYINTFYKIIFEMLIPMYNGISIKYKNKKYEDKEHEKSYSENQFIMLRKIIEENKRVDLNILSENKTNCELLFKKKKFFLKYENEEMMIKKIKDRTLRLSSENMAPNFILIKTNKKEKIKKDAII